MYDRTIYELTSGGRHSQPEQARYFGPCNASDAFVRASERILDLDHDDSVGGAWVHLKRLPDSIYPEGLPLIYWTKTSNESPTSDGELAPSGVK